MGIPAGLGPRGAAFWADITGAFELDRAQKGLITRVCRMLDRADQLRREIDRHGLMITDSRGTRKPAWAVLEERQITLAIGRLLGQLELPDEGGVRSTRSKAGTHAVEASWRRVRKAIG
jgi:Phage terminase, small subunit